MKQLSIPEFITGLLAGVFLPVAATCFITGTLWMLGGTYYKPIRRLGVPVTAVLVSYSMFHWSFLLTIPVGYAILCIGDGYPDSLTEDKGSWLGRFVSRFINDVVDGNA